MMSSGDVKCFADVTLPPAVFWQMEADFLQQEMQHQQCSDSQINVNNLVACLFLWFFSLPYVSLG
jgi:hypothetical protein